MRHTLSNVLLTIAYVSLLIGLAMMLIVILNEQVDKNKATKMTAPFFAVGVITLGLSILLG
jgi:hypothetical protein